MSKAIILTIRLKYFYLTYKGIKTIEVRKSCPKGFVGDVYEYVSKTNWKKDLLEIPENERDFFKQFVGKVGLKFTLNEVEGIHDCYDNGNYYREWIGVGTETMFEDKLCEKACLTTEELYGYIDADKKGYAWHIDNLEIFDEPKELGEFMPAKWDKCGIKDKNGLYQCKKCPYGFSEGYYCECRYKPLTKAPQNYMFIEVEE